MERVAHGNTVILSPKLCHPIIQPIIVVNPFLVNMDVLLVLSLRQISWWMALKACTSHLHAIEANKLRNEATAPEVFVCVCVGGGGGGEN